MISLFLFLKTTCGHLNMNFLVITTIVNLINFKLKKKSFPYKKSFPWKTQPVDRSNMAVAVIGRYLDLKC